jgi:hypothetical protein
MKMNAMADYTEALRTTKALVLYDDFTLIAGARRVAADLAERPNGEAHGRLEMQITYWRFERLKRGSEALRALTDGLDARVVLVTVHHDRRLPSWLTRWLEVWAEKRRRADAMLAAVRDNAPAAPAEESLRLLAERQRLLYVSVAGSGRLEAEAATPLQPFGLLKLEAKPGQYDSPLGLAAMLASKHFAEPVGSGAHAPSDAG